MHLLIFVVGMQWWPCTAHYMILTLFLYLTNFAVLAIFTMPFGNLVNQLQDLRVQVQDHIQEHIQEHRQQHHQQGQQPQNIPPPPPPRPNTQQQPPPRQCSPEAFSILRRRWFNQIVGDPESIDRSDPNVKAAIEGISSGGKWLLRKYELGDDHVFQGVGPLVPKDMKFKDTYGKLLQLAIAWATEGTELYHNQDVLDKIIAGLDHVHEIVFNEATMKPVIASRVNWWAIQIGAPMNLADICVILYDHIDEERRKRWGTTSVSLVGNTAIPSLKGGNRAWMSRVLIITGISMDDPDVVRKGIATLSAEGPQNVKCNTLFDYVKPGAGEGIYEDGSLISHDVYPYAGGYGLAMLGSVALLLNLLNAPESPEEFRVTDPNVRIIYESVERNFVPVVWSGMIFEHVRGRELSRVGTPGWASGHSLTHAVAALSQGSDGQTASYLESLAKLWTSSSPESPLSKASLPQITTLKPIIKGRSGPVARPPTGAFSAPVQEHFAYHAPDSTWCFTLSLSSTRIGRAESLNNENLKSWYQGDGMTYLYTVAHKTHYADDYWPTMDPLHVPGTTNHQTVPPPFQYKSMGYRDWSGGACWAGGGGGNGSAFGSNGRGARFAAASFDHYAVDKRSAAKKSWFMLEDGIIALGAGCTGNADPPSNLHTTIESRNLNNQEQAFIVDGEEMPTDEGWSKQSGRVSWAWLDGTAGYIFLDNLPKEFSRTKRCGDWHDINCLWKAKNACHRYYLNIFLDHGVNPKTSEYAYVILPLASVETTAQLAEQPHWKILQNDVKIQAIVNGFEGGEITMATFWAAGSINGIGVGQPCQLIWGRYGRDWCLSVSDPTHKVRRVVVTIDQLGGLQKGDASQGVSVNGNQVVFDGLQHGATKSIFFSGGGSGHDEL
ncbi:Chondroitinase-AC [Dactylella cylindrospora]|nr:Chondroitinase-AC [Dactylella cylindrospora]